MVGPRPTFLTAQMGQGGAGDGVKAGVTMQGAGAWCGGGFYCRQDQGCHRKGYFGFLELSAPGGRQILYEPWGEAVSRASGSGLQF